MSRCTALLACPVCGASLDGIDGSMRCASGHNFNRARAGYIDLLPPGHGSSGIRGDVREMVDARRRFLERGHYDAISGAVNDLAAHSRRRVVLDAGCGEGWYLRRFATQRAHDDECFLGCDVSRDALRLAARSHRDATFFVNDVARRISMADASVDVLLNIFAPRNPTEFARVLPRDGLLIVAMPAEDHLIELREQLPLLDVPAGKRERTAASVQGTFELSAARELRYTVELTADDVRDVIVMGPSYWHVDAGGMRFEAARVSVAVDVLGFARV